MDRNSCISCITYALLKSHSARGAWIETIYLRNSATDANVALREGCVDRNISGEEIELDSDKSHSARGAWIET